MPAKDLRYALRTLSRSPGFTLTALLTIALGIGASTAIFSVVNAVLLRPLPYAEQDRLVTIWGDLTARNVTDFPMPPGDLYDLRLQGTLFEQTAAIVTGRFPLRTEDAEPEMIRAANVTPNFFRTLGARVAAGRDFLESDGLPQPQPPQGAAPAPDAANQPPPLPTYAILSHEFWRRRYGSDPAILGKPIRIGNQSAEVVGVLAAGFEVLFPPGVNIERNPEVYTAMRIDLESGSRINVFLRVVGRLKPGVSLEQAQAQIDGLVADLRRRFPIKETAGLRWRVEPMHQDLVADVRETILTLMGAVLFVLLIACANVANLLLVRASSRERELAVRSALGGARWQLLRQMLLESLTLAGVGALLGLGLAWAGTRLLLAIGPESLPRLDAVGLDPLVLGFTALAAIVAAVVFGLWPAYRASRVDVAEVLRTGGRNAGLASGGRLLRNGVVMAEVALAFVLLVGSGLMVRSFIAISRADPGFDPDGLLTFQLPNLGRRTDQEREVFVRQLKERLEGLPSVTAVAATGPLPLDGGSSLVRYGTEAAAADPALFQQATLRLVQPGYFETMRTRLVAGRLFNDADNVRRLRLTIVDTRLADKAFPGQAAVGKRILSRTGGQDPELFEIIGVVGHQRSETLAQDGREVMYLPDAFFGFGAANRWVVRTSGDPATLAPPVRAAIRELDRSVPVVDLQPMQVFVDRARAPTRFALVLIGLFAGVAAILAAVGLYGVLASLVRQRTAEIGVRMALGAERGSIFRLVIGQGLKLSAVGIGLGILGALGLTRVMTSMLVEVRPSDPSTFASIGMLFFGIAALAAWLPARRAAALDPTAALREE